MTANNLPPRLYYRLDEAAQLLGCTESDLIHWGAVGDVALLCRLPSVKATADVITNWVTRGVVVDTLAVIGSSEIGFPKSPHEQFLYGDEMHLEVVISGVFIISDETMAQIETHGEAGPPAFVMGAVDEFQADELVDWLAVGELGSPLAVDDDGWAALDISASVMISRDSLLVPAATITALQARSESRRGRPQKDEFTDNKLPSGPTSQGADGEKPTAAPKTLNQQRAFAEQLGKLFGRAVSADDSCEPMTIVMELLEGSKYAHLIKTPGSLYSELDRAAARKGLGLVVKVDAFTKWLRQKP